jgi:hypothetical protein
MGSSEKTIFKDRIIVSKPDLADQWPSWSGVGIRSGLKKTEEVMTWGDLVDPVKSSKKLGCHPLIIFLFFYQKNIILIYKKIKLTRMIRALDRVSKLCMNPVALCADVMVMDENHAFQHPSDGRVCSYCEGIWC